MPIETDPAETPEDTTTADPQAEEERAESAETETVEGSETSEDQGKAEAKPEESDEFEIVVDGEPAKAEEPAPKDNAAWAASRIREREKDARIAQLEREAQARTQSASAAGPGPAPTDEDPDVLWDREKLLAKHAKWLKVKEVHDAEQVKLNKGWEETKASIFKSRQELIKQTPGYEKAETVADSHLSHKHFGEIPALALIMRACKGKTPLVMAALGSDLARLNDLAGENDILEFVSKVKELEGKVKMLKKSGTTPPPPESKIRGTGGGSGAVDAQEERLREQSMKGGAVDITALRAYKKSRAK